MKEGYIRLVFSSDEMSPENVALNPSDEHQLSLPFAEAEMVLFLHIEDTRPAEFMKLVSHYRPSWIIDVRAVPRLDILVSSRSAAFSVFEKSGATYIDLFGRLGVRSYRSAGANPVFWSNAISELLSESEKRGPFLLIFDNQGLLNEAQRVLPRAVSGVLGDNTMFKAVRELEME